MTPSELRAPWYTRAWVFGAICAAILIAAWFFFRWAPVAAWTTRWTGQDEEAGGHYGFWSGFGGALPDVLIASGLLAWYWRGTCHNAGCWLPGKHEAAGGLFKMCRWHHPDIAGRKVDHHLIHRLHREHIERMS
jgi:hypothetical protein